ncbi:4Fe-4S dicluster domain-containing protein [Patulibacter sp. S7RM1-6]
MAPESYGDRAQKRKGFFTDTSLCIGCKACEIACKEWNHVPADGQDFTGESLDNTSALGANTWRHVAFVEQRVDADEMDLVARAELPQGLTPVGDHEGFRWLMSSDVCKHCTHAACLDVCPTGALFRTEHGTVVVQQDICNGCGYCVPACPFGVLDRRKEDGRVWKCTLCYDRLDAGQEPACAKACPTKSIQFGELDDLRAHAAQRVEQLHERGVTDARLYLDDDADGIAGAGAFFLLLDEPEVYGFPPDPVDTTSHLGEGWRAAGMAMLAMAGAVAGAVAWGQRS